MNTLLMIWTVVVGYTGAGSPKVERWDWRQLGNFRSPTHCEEAAKQLALDPKKYRCVSTGLTQS